MELPSQREVLLSNPWPGERQISKPSIPNIPVTTKPAVIAQSGQITGILKNETNLTHFPQINALWEKFGLRHVSSNQLPLAGRLKYFVKNWELVTNDPWVLQAVSGYQICFSNLPFQKTIPAMMVSVEDQEVINKEVEELIEKQAIQYVPPQQHSTGFLSTLFVVPKKGGGHRPIFNLKQLNHFVQYEHFKMEGIHMLRDLLQPNDYMAKIDLKDAYFTIPIWKNHQKFLRFLWKDTQWKFMCLPFGLASAPHVFTKILKPIVGLLRKQGIRLIIYLDDILLMASTAETLSHHVALTVALLELLGFVVNYQKSQLNPVQSLEFLGFQINSVTFQISLPKDKVKNIKRECQKVLDHQTITVRELARLLGKLSASIQAVFPAPLHYRYLQAVNKQSLAKQGSYEAPVIWSATALEELKWWRDHLTAWNGKALLREPPTLIIETDASTTGWGARCGQTQTRGLWSQTERLLHINCLELLAGGFALKSFLKSKCNIHVLLLMDNTSAISYINKMGGSTSLVLSSLAFDLWQWCLERSITVEAHHLPGRLNTVADYESRAGPDSSDWQLDPVVFQKINSKWGPFAVDLFATRLTAQLPRFVSWKPDPVAEAVDAFTLDWSQLAGHDFPPFALIGRCLRQIQQQSVPQITMVTPVWETQSWYPLLLGMIIEAPVLLPSFPGLLRQEDKLHPLAHLQLAAWRVSGEISTVRQFHRQLKDFSWLHGEPEQRRLTLLPGGSGLAGVVNNKSIHFQHL